ncbi:MAG: glucokinase [Myxococcales bacterium]|nr:glucokinase [Myxococcales bacterium]
MQILAGDVGGTKTWLGLFECDGDQPALRELREAQLPSADHPSLDHAIATFLGDDRVDAAAFGVAGPVLGRRVEVTNLPWVVDADALEQALGVPRVYLANDFHVVALGLEVLPPEACVELQRGVVDPSGPRVLLGAGTGLGKAVVVPSADGPKVLASEGGHIGFPPRDAFEDGLAAWLRARHGRATWEHVVSGLGLSSLYRYVVEAGHAHGDLFPAATTTTGPTGGEIAEAYDRDEAARLTLDRFVSLYGAAAGDLALEVVASGGLFVAGGIAPKLHRQLGQHFVELFCDAFRDKAPMRALAERTNVTLVTDPKVGLLGAAALARRTR